MPAGVDVTEPLTRDVHGQRLCVVGTTAVHVFVADALASHGPVLSAL